MPSHDVRILSVRRAAGVIVTALCVLLSSAAPVGAADVARTRTQRQQVNEKQARVAEQVDAAKASAKEAQAAIDTLNRDLDAQQRKFNDSVKAAGRAKEALVAAQAREEEANKTATAATAAMRKRLVDDYMTGRGAVDDTASRNAMTNGHDPARTQVLVHVAMDSDARILDQYLAATKDQARARAAAQAANDTAVKVSAQQAKDLSALKISLLRQQKLSQDLDRRLDERLAEADALAATDKQLSDQIRAEEAAVAAQVAAARKAASEAAAARAQAEGQNPQQAAREASAPAPAIPVTGGGEIQTVGGIQVHRSIAPKVQAMLAAAAADGVQLTGSGWRDPSQQIQLRAQNCGSSNFAIYQMSAGSCSPPTARPGQSMHERGLAIDFRNCSYGSPSFNWLRANAARFGFYNLPSESWHWSTTGN